jgi:non-ribosomal peptide synthetase component E (peptide arylation enzyme)
MCHPEAAFATIARHGITATYLDGRGVAAHARPDRLVTMPSLPTTAVGKVDKKAIVAQLTG